MIINNIKELSWMEVYLLARELEQFSTPDSFEIFCGTRTDLFNLLNEGYVATYKKMGIRESNPFRYLAILVKPDNADLPQGD